MRKKKIQKNKIKYCAGDHDYASKIKKHTIAVIICTFNGISIILTLMIFL